MIKNAGGSIPIAVIFGVPVAIIVAGFLFGRSDREQPEEAAALPSGAALLTTGSASLSAPEPS
jgi:hypothetical protein